MIILWTAASFLCGSFMFSYWLGLILRHNLRAEGDGNPGAANLWRAAGHWYGLAGIFLDFLKGYIPVALLVNTGTVTDYGLIAVAAAPVVGHAFSPFIGWKGGKAIAVTFGVWSGLTHFAGSLALAVILAVLQVVFRLFLKGRPLTSRLDAFMVVLGMFLLSIYVFWADYGPEIHWFWLCSLLLLVITHRRELLVTVRHTPTGLGG